MDTHGARHISSKGKGSYVLFWFSLINSLHTQASFKPWNLGEGHPSGAATYRVPHVPQTQKLLRKAETTKWKVHRESPAWARPVVRGGSGPPKRRGDSSPPVGRLTPSKRAILAVTLSQYLRDVMASPSCPKQQRWRPMLRVRSGSSSRYHSNCFSASAQALSDRSASSHPGHGQPTRWLAEPAGGGRTAPGPRPERSRRRCGLPRATRASGPGELALGLANWLAGSVNILSPGRSVLPSPGLRGMRSGARLKNGYPTANGFISHMAKVYLGELRSLYWDLRQRHYRTNLQRWGLTACKNPSAEEKLQPSGKPQTEENPTPGNSSTIC